MQQSLDWIAEALSNGLFTAETFPWKELRYEHTAAVRAQLAEQYKHTTANKMLCALRGVLRETWRLGLTDVETYHRAADIKKVKGSGYTQGRALSKEELHRLLKACQIDPSPAGRRDTALITLLYGCGLRRTEAVELNINNLLLPSRELTVHGKGNRQRTMPLSANAVGILQAWHDVRGDRPGPLLLPIRRGGHLVERRMTDQAIATILYKRPQQAQITPTAPHDLRRTFATHLLDAGVDVYIVQNLMGHANVQTTQRYDHRDELAKRQAIDLLMK